MGGSLLFQRADFPFQILDEVSDHQSDFAIWVLARELAVVGKLPLKLLSFFLCAHLESAPGGK